MSVIKLDDSMYQIQKKLDEGGTIKFVRGTYQITQTLRIAAGSTINLNQSTLQRCGNIENVFTNKFTKKTTKYNGDGNITIKDGTIEGMGNYTARNLVTFFHSHDIRIENVTFKDVLMHGVEINSTNRITISNCQFLGYNYKSGTLYKEMIQIDTAAYGAFGYNNSSPTDLAYDGTPCLNVTITNCEFNKSKYRDYPSACIGTHSQYKGCRPHRNIMISKNKFICGGAGTNVACISLIHMMNVTIENNQFTNVGRAIFIKTADHSINQTGEAAQEMDTTDGLCENIYIRGNTVFSANDGVKATGVYVTSYNDGQHHKNIEIINNKFAQKQGTYCIYLSHVDEYKFYDNISKLKIKVDPKTCMN